MCQQPPQDTRINDANLKPLHLPISNYYWGKNLNGQCYGEYSVIKELEPGSSSKVWLAEHQTTKQYVVLKFTANAGKSRASSLHNQHVEQESKLLSLFHHPNIVQVFSITDQLKCSGMVMEYGGPHCLLNYILEKEFLDESEACKLFRQLVSAVSYMHDNCIVHRSLSLEKIMVDEMGRVRLTNMRFATPFQSHRGLTTYHGYPYYASPEMVNGEPYCGPEVDIWALGVSLYTMLCGQVPFAGNSLLEIYQNVLTGTFPMPEFLSEEAQDLLHQLLHHDPTKRISMDALIDHPWMNEEYEELVDNHMPQRPSVVHKPHMPTVQQLTLFNFDIDTAIKSLADEGSIPTAAVCAYHLLEEKRLRESEATEGISLCNSKAHEGILEIKDTQKESESANKSNNVVNDEQAADAEPPLIDFSS